MHAPPDDVTTPTPDEAARIAAVDAVLRAWLELPEVALVSGQWRHGGIMELVLDRDASLTPPAYGGRFSGLRDITVRGLRHHMHVDLARVTRVSYAVVPSVCYGFRPSFEVHFARGDGPDDHVFSLSLLSPYRDGALDAPRVARYFAAMRAHAEAHPALVRFVAERGDRGADHDATWRAVGRCFADVAGLAEAPASPAALVDAVRADRPSASAAAAPLPEALAVLDAALALRGASLVVYRARTLVEFKTERLAQRVTAYEESGHRSWQIGAFDDHHCHLDLDAVTRAHFDAEPVSCQGARLNWTVWFLGDKDCGNPYRPEAVCSVTLNRPHDERGVVDGVYALYDRVRERACVTASEVFLAARPATA